MWLRRRREAFIEEMWLIRANPILAHFDSVNNPQFQILPPCEPPKRSVAPFRTVPRPLMSISAHHSSSVPSPPPPCPHIGTSIPTSRGHPFQSSNPQARNPAVCGTSPGLFPARTTSRVRDWRSTCQARDVRCRSRKGERRLVTDALYFPKAQIQSS